MERPEVWLNCAVGRDGRMAAPDGSPVRFSGPEDLARVHRMRAAADAILVGIGTVLADDPSLRVKAEYLDPAKGPGSFEDPLRVVLDAHGRVPGGARVLDGSAPTVVVTGPDAAPVSGATQLRLPAPDGRIDLDALLAALAGLGVRSVMVEGGAEVLRAFLDPGRWDRCTVYVADVEVGGDGPRLWDRSMDELGLHGRDAALGDGRLWTFDPVSPA